MKRNPSWFRKGDPRTLACAIAGGNASAESDNPGHRWREGDPELKTLGRKAGKASAARRAKEKT